MRSVSQENTSIAQLLPFEFEKKEFKLNCWGQADFYCLHEGVLVLLEIEKGQKHPNTNVLKVWPYLDEYPEKKILLIQLIREENRAPKNRLNLCKFTGKKLEEMYAGRFSYVNYDWSVNILNDLQREIEQKLEQLK